MNPVKITITPEEFKKWCDGDILPTERMSQEQLMKERAEAQRRKQYEQLREEFGND